MLIVFTDSHPTKSDSHLTEKGLPSYHGLLFYWSDSQLTKIGLQTYRQGLPSYRADSQLTSDAKVIVPTGAVKMEAKKTWTVMQVVVAL